MCYNGTKLWPSNSFLGGSDVDTIRECSFVNPRIPNPTPVPTPQVPTPVAFDICTASVCVNGFSAKAVPANCAGPACTVTECCMANPFCVPPVGSTDVSYICTKGVKLLKAASDAIRCMAELCTDVDCCETPGNCNGFSCDVATSFLRVDATTSFCDEVKCNAAFCCTPLGKCSANLCTAKSVLKWPLPVKLAYRVSHLLCFFTYSCFLQLFLVASRLCVVVRRALKRNAAMTKAFVPHTHVQVSLCFAPSPCKIL